jgi:hypothetical protein
MDLNLIRLSFNMHLIILQDIFFSSILTDCSVRYLQELKITALKWTVIWFEKLYFGLKTYFFALEYVEAILHGLVNN